jgi:tetratricopeptide (TPR) repeat protein
LFCVSTTGDADAARRRAKAKAPAATQPAETTPNDRRDNNTLCDGGTMITADDQIRGCTALLKTRIDRARKATALYNRGNAQIGKSDFARAIGDYTDALALKPDYTQALFNRAVAHRVSGNAQGAIADYTAVLALTPADADALVGRGMAHVSIGEHAKGLSDFNQALGLQPGHLTALIQRGHTYVRAHQWDAAISDYTAAMAISPAGIEATYGRGVARIYHGDLDGQADITKAVIADSAVTARMTSQGIPPPIVRTAGPFEAATLQPPAPPTIVEPGIGDLKTSADAAVSDPAPAASASPPVAPTTDEVAQESSQSESTDTATDKPPVKQRREPYKMAPIP